MSSLKAERVLDPLTILNLCGLAPKHLNPVQEAYIETCATKFNEFMASVEKEKRVSQGLVLRMPWAKYQVVGFRAVEEVVSFKWGRS